MQSVESGWADSGGEQEKKLEVRKITVLKSTSPMLLQKGNYVYYSLTSHIFIQFFLFYYFDPKLDQERRFFIIRNLSYSYVHYIHEYHNE
jgi:hypothetical protein